MTVVARGAAAGRGVWQLGPHNHSLARLYHFTDPALEAQYQRRANGWRLWFARLHFYLSTFFGLLSALSFLPSMFVTTFWVHCSHAIVSMAFALTSHTLVPEALTVAHHGVFCVIELLLYLSILRPQTSFWTDLTYNSFVPAGADLALLGSNHTVLVDDRFQSLVFAIHARQALSLCILEVSIIWPFLAMMGLSWCSLGPPSSQRPTLLQSSPAR
eukprot:EG_transcript_21312